MRWSCSSTKSGHRRSVGTASGSSSTRSVLGSSGSVLTIWNAQLAEGGPLTVTDERMTRYFMTIAEAASLVVQAAAFSGTGPIPTGARSGEVFVLDMGQPINIFTLAQRFIRACGCEPVIGQPAGSVGPDRVPVILTGARPGEKLHEQLSYDAEALGANAGADWFAEYMQAAMPLLAGEPQVTMATPLWSTGI